MTTPQQIEVLAIQVAQPGRPTQQVIDAVSALDLDDQLKVTKRASEIARQIAEAAQDEADRLNEEVRIMTFGPKPDRPGEPN